jgi:hypothetical protein
MGWYLLLASRLGFAVVRLLRCECVVSICVAEWFCIRLSCDIGVSIVYIVVLACSVASLVSCLCPVAAATVCFHCLLRRHVFSVSFLDWVVLFFVEVCLLFVFCRPLSISFQ